MARSDVETLLPLDQFAQIMGFEPFQFNQIKEGLALAREAQCNTVMYQHNFQRQFFSLDEIAAAITQAEESLAPILNYYPAPKYIVNDDITYPVDYRTGTPYFLTARGQWKAVQTTYQHIQTLGTRTRTLIQANVVYTTSDDDGDSIDDHFTVSVATTETDLSKLVLYFASADRQALDETWRIRPLRVTADGVNATFKGHIGLLVDPALKESLDPVPLVATDTGIYVTGVDAYILSYDTSLIGTSYWDTSYSCGISSGGVSPNTILVKPKDGYIRLVIDGCYSMGYAPDRISLNYLAGVPYDNTGRMQEPYATAVAALALAYMPSPACGCTRADQKISYYMSTPADSEQGKRPMSLKEIDNNPFPPTRGGLLAWDLCLRRQHIVSARS